MTVGGPGSAGYQASGGRHLRVMVQFRVASAVQPDGSLNHASGEVEPDEFSLVQAPTDHELFPCIGVAHVLQLVLVLIGPERMNVVVGIGRAEHRSRSRAALFLAIVVVLDSHPAE